MNSFHGDYTVVLYRDHIGVCKENLISINSPLTKVMSLFSFLALGYGHACAVQQIQNRHASSMTVSLAFKGFQKSRSKVQLESSTRFRV